MIIIEIIGVLFLIGVLGLLIARWGGGMSRPSAGERRFREVGPGQARSSEKPRATGIN
jgi:hypothetical protein